MIAPKGIGKTYKLVQVTHGVYICVATTWIHNRAKLTVGILETGVDSILPEVSCDSAVIVDRQRIRRVGVRIFDDCEGLRGNIVNESARSRISDDLALIV